MGMGLLDIFGKKEKEKGKKQRRRKEKNPIDRRKNGMNRRKARELAKDCG